MTWHNLKSQARTLLHEQGLDELKRHARVSTQNRHRCRACFCCACLAVIEDYAMAPDKERRAMEGK
jgi:hypothetical protein